MLDTFYETIKQCGNTKKIFADIHEKPLTYQNLLNAVRQTVTLLRTYNLQGNQRIMIVTKDDQSLLFLLLSAMLEGHCVILLAPDTKIAKLKNIVDLANPQLIFIDQINAEACRAELNCPIIAIDDAKEKHAFINKILGKTKEKSGSYPALLQLLQQTEPNCAVKLDDFALIVFTSGSTASPKAVMLSYKNVFTHLATFKKVFSYNEQCVLFNSLPLYHMDGLIQGPMITLYCGATLIRPEKFCLQNLDLYFNKISAKKVSHVILVPSTLALLDRYAIHNDYFHTTFFQMLISTAAHLNADLWARLQARFKIKICNVYGLIETVTGGLFCGPDPARFAIGTVGAPVDMLARIIDETGQEQNDGEIGELLLQGDNVSSGYLGQTANNPVFKNGWLYTGDLARKNQQGLIEIIGRKKEVILSDGLTVHPEEINEILLKHPDVKDAATFGLEDQIWGEIIITAIEATGTLTETELHQFSYQYLEAEKVPKQIIFMHEIPRGPTGKPQLAILKKLAKEKNSGISSFSFLSEAEVVALAAQVFNIPTTTLSMYSNPLNIIAWDSLGHIRLIEAAERKFQVHFHTHDITGITSLRDLYERTEKLLAQH
jgi:acyl-CoA synthetase (AMP-forming)/AMP-acid ligase II/acyl carrier protein